MAAQAAVWWRASGDRLLRCLARRAAIGRHFVHGVGQPACDRQIRIPLPLAPLWILPAIGSRSRVLPGRWRCPAEVRYILVHGCRRLAARMGLQQYAQAFAVMTSMDARCPICGIRSQGQGVTSVDTGAS